MYCWYWEKRLLFEFGSFLYMPLWMSMSEGWERGHALCQHAKTYAVHLHHVHFLNNYQEVFACLPIVTCARSLSGSSFKAVTACSLAALMSFTCKSREITSQALLCHTMCRTRWRYTHISFRDESLLLWPLLLLRSATYICFHACMHAFSVCLDWLRSFEVLKAFTLVLLSVKIVSRAMLKEAATCGRLAFGFASIACKSDITWGTAFGFLSPTPVASHQGPYTISNLLAEALCSLRLLRTWNSSQMLRQSAGINPEEDNMRATKVLTFSL